MADDLKLPPGATLLKLPPGATAVTEPDQPAASPSWLDSAHDVASSLWEGLGGQAAMDILGGATRDPERAKKALETAKGLVHGLINEPGRIWDQSVKAGDAMIHGDVPGAAFHMGGMAPLVGPGAQQVGTDVDQGHYARGFGHAMALFAPFIAPEAAARIKPAAAAPAAAELPEQAAARVSGNLKSSMQNTPWGDLTDIQQAAAAGDTHAQQVLDAVQNTGDTPSRVQQASINLSDYRTAQKSDALYQKVQDLTDAHQLGEVPLGSTMNTMGRVVKDLQTAKAYDKPLTDYLRDIQARLKPLEAGAPAGNTYSRIRDLVSDLGEKIRMNSAGENAVIGPKGVAKLQQVKDALESDLSDFTAKSNVPEVQKAAEAADQYYREARVPFKDAGLSRAATTDEADTIFQSFIKAGRGDKAQKFYDALDPKGQAAVQYQLVTKAMNDATDVVKGFDSKRFVQSMDKLQDSYGVFFKGSDKWAIDGMRNVALQAAKAEAAPFGAVGAFIPRIEKYANYLMTTPQGRQLLYQASSLKPGSALLQGIWQRIQSTASKAAGAAGNFQVPAAAASVINANAPNFGKLPQEQQ